MSARASVSWKAELEAAAVALLVALAVGSLLIIVDRASPWVVWRALFARSLGSTYGLGSVLFRATALALLGLAVAVPRAAGLFNIGGEGQMITGALLCAIVAAAIPAGTPALIALPLALAVAAAAGGAIGAATGALRAYRGAHEVIVGICLNAVITGVALWVGNRWLFVGETTRTAEIVPGARLPGLGLGASNASASLFLALAAVVATSWVLSRTTTGLRWRMVGAGPDAAAASGVDVARARLTAMTAAGALAGLAGAHFVLGYKHAYEEGLGRNQGFLGIAVALLAAGRPAAVGVSALVFGLLAHGGLEVGSLVPKELVDVLQASVVLVAAATATGWGRRR
ncbi:MAG TPA: ABC transporter permease [Kofleriaceae bacterium]|nr:ABC transporter permease [Kofleriaceae bacterium]